MFQISHLVKEFNSVPAVNDVTTKIDRGEVVFIVGPSGSGKSTFLRCLNLLEEPTSGRITVDGVDIGDVSDVALRDRRMLSADGIFIVVATVSESDGSSVVPPEVLARGVPFLDDNSEFVEELREAVGPAAARFLIPSPFEAAT